MYSNIANMTLLKLPSCSLSVDLYSASCFVFLNKPQMFCTLIVHVGVTMHSKPANMYIIMQLKKAEIYYFWYVYEHFLDFHTTDILTHDIYPISSVITQVSYYNFYTACVCICRWDIDNNGVCSENKDVFFLNIRYLFWGKPHCPSAQSIMYIELIKGRGNFVLFLHTFEYNYSGMYFEQNRS